MRIACLDDDRAELDKLQKYLSELLPPQIHIDLFTNAEDFFALWKPQLYDLILLDIFMGDAHGVDVARRIRASDPHVSIAFCTTSNEFAGESYEVNAGYYLNKPFTREKIQKMLDRLALDEIEYNRAVAFPDGQRMVLRNILFTEYSNHTVTIHAVDGEDIRVRFSQTELEALLCNCAFLVPCGQGIIVNFHEVRALTDSDFILKNGASVPISRRRFKEIKNAYNDFRFEQMRKGRQRL